MLLCHLLHASKLEHLVNTWPNLISNMMCFVINYLKFDSWTLIDLWPWKWVVWYRSLNGTMLTTANKLNKFNSWQHYIHPVKKLVISGRQLWMQKVLSNLKYILRTKHVMLNQVLLDIWILGCNQLLKTYRRQYRIFVSTHRHCFNQVSLHLQAILLWAVLMCLPSCCPV